MTNPLPRFFSNSLIATSATRSLLFNSSTSACSSFTFCSSSNSLEKPPCLKNISVKSFASKKTSKFLISSLLMCDVTTSLYSKVLSTAYTICSFWSGYTSFQILCEEIGRPSSLLSTRKVSILSFASYSVIMSIYCRLCVSARTGSFAGFGRAVGMCGQQMCLLCGQPLLCRAA